MRSVVEARLTALKIELEKAERLVERIRGAIMVCEELLTTARQEEASVLPDRDDRASEKEG